jgi:hypothetical protein
MPEEAEIDLDKLRETIDDEIEHGGGNLLRWISLTTAVLAALAAVTSLRAGSTVNEGLVLKTEATQLQAEASDQWAYYQAKGIKLAVSVADADAWRAAGKPVPDAVTAAAARYPHEQDSIRTLALAKEHDRDARSVEADQLLNAHHHYAYAVAFFQLAIALGAVAALTRSRPVWWLSLALGLGGLGIFGMQMLG